MKTLLLGSTGLLGREVLLEFSRLGDVIAVSRSGARGSIPVDIRDADALVRLVREQRPDVVMLLAAYREPDFCEEDPLETRRLNTAPARVLRESLPTSTRLLFVSTDYVFDGESPPYSETSPRNPLSEYGRSKVEAEDALADRRNTIILRVPLLVGGGPTLQDCGFIRLIIEDARRAQPVELDNVLIRVPTWTRDVARGMSFLIQQDAEGVFHLSGPRGATRYAWSVEIARHLRLPFDHFLPSSRVIPRKARRPRDSTLDDRKLRELGFSERTDFPSVVDVVLAELQRLESRVS